MFRRDIEGYLAMPDVPSVTFIGFCEAGQAIAAGWREACVATISAWDILLPTAEGERLRQRPRPSASPAQARPPKRFSAPS